MSELIITEKPSTAKKIAEALSDGKPEKLVKNKVAYFEVEYDGKQITIVSAVGHLFGLAEIKKTGFTYPVFDIEWKPSFEVSKGAEFSKKYYDVIKKMAKGKEIVTVATDYDIEGEVIGLNIVRHICNKKDARRMKFSTVTKDELEEAYKDAGKTLNWGQANAGETRHKLDWYYGINVSRALSSSIKKAGMFKILSSGRVQGPALQIIVEKEQEIQKFKADPYWQLEMHSSVKAGKLESMHKIDKFWKEDEADAILKKTKGKDGKIESVKSSKREQAPPTPFDLTTLQTEAYRSAGIPPKETLEHAQDLYSSGYTSYPRTSSQQLPPSIGFKKILEALSKQSDYTELCKELLKGKLQPNNGKKTDPAHPAIYPTGQKPKLLTDRKKKVYDLIVRRFMSTFAEPAVRETSTITIDVEGEPFITKGTRTTVPGWHTFYGPHVKLKDEELVKVTEGEKVSVKEINKLDKETQPPPRYTPSSIIRELEKRNLGTKATRASIIDTLETRNYIDGKSIQATKLGFETVFTLKKFVPALLDEELTRSFEGQMEEIREGKKNEEDVLTAARELLTDVFGEFKKHELEVGEGILTATKETEDKANTVGPCQVCDGTLMFKKGKFGRFIACSKYPDCEATFKLPSNALFKPSDKTCETCNHPEILVIKKGKRPQTACINLDCPDKEVDAPGLGEKCEKCKKGTMILRKSLYGRFLGCDQFPKCRTLKRLQ